MTDDTDGRINTVHDNNLNRNEFIPVYKCIPQNVYAFVYGSDFSYQLDTNLREEVFQFPSTQVRHCTIFYLWHYNPLKPKPSFQNRTPFSSFTWIPGLEKVSRNQVRGRRKMMGLFRFLFVNDTQWEKMIMRLFYFPKGLNPWHKRGGSHGSSACGKDRCLRWGRFVKGPLKQR